VLEPRAPLSQTEVPELLRKLALEAPRESALPRAAAALLAAQFESPRPSILWIGDAHDEALALQVRHDLHGSLVGDAKTLAQLALVQRPIRDSRGPRYPTVGPASPKPYRAR